MEIYIHSQNIANIFKFTYQSIQKLILHIFVESVSFGKGEKDKKYQKFNLFITSIFLHFLTATI